MFSLLILLCCVHASLAGNILVISVLTGSHLTATYDIAAELASAGHNVTFVCLVRGGKIPFTQPNITVVDLPGVHKDILNEHMASCINTVIERDSAILMAASSVCRASWGRVLENGRNVVTSPDFRGLVVSTDLIICEMPGPFGVSAMAALHNRPVVGYNPGHMAAGALFENNLPGLLNSQPSVLVQDNFHQPPTFSERVKRLIEFFRYFLPFFSVFPESEKMSEELIGVSGKNSVKLHLTNDQNVMTFPWLRAPNDIEVGAIALLDATPPPLPKDLAEFINPGVILVTFGSYAAPDKFGWYKELVTIMEGLGKRVVIKAASPVSSSSEILSMNWVPQRALLASGKVDLFISHCGNNGRIETIFYGVPVLCVPLFGDQNINAEVIRFKGFGDKMVKESIGSQGERTIRALLEAAPDCRARMNRATEWVKRSGMKERLLMNIEELLKWGDLDHLVNPIVLQQGSMEMYGLDILALLLAIVLSVLGLLLYGLVKCGRAFCCKGKKPKQE